MSETLFAPVFPLPTVNLFPRTTASYHIFEPRYLEMIASILEGDGLLVMATLKPGYEADYYGAPEIYPLGCLGRIQSYEKLENGNYDIVVEGLVRVGIGALVKDYPYRIARLEQLPELDQGQDFQAEREDLLLRLNYLVTYAPENMDYSPVLQSNEPFDALINLVAKTLPLNHTEHYDLLAMDTIRERAQKILSIIDDQIDTMELMKRVDPHSPDLMTYN